MMWRWQPTLVINVSRISRKIKSANQNSMLDKLFTSNGFAIFPSTLLLIIIDLDCYIPNAFALIHIFTKHYYGGVLPSFNKELE